MERPDQIGGEHEAALQDGDDQQVLGFRASDILGQFLDAAGNCLFVEENPDAGRGRHRQSIHIGAGGKPRPRTSISFTTMARPRSQTASVPAALKRPAVERFIPLVDTRLGSLSAANRRG